jgi:hypothetical protein
MIMEQRDKEVILFLKHEIVPRIVSVDQRLSFYDLDNYGNILLRLFIHCEALAASGHRELVSDLAKLVALNLRENKVVTDPKEFIVEAGGILNAVHGVWVSDMQNFINGQDKIPFLNFRVRFRELVTKREAVLSTDILKVFEETVYINTLFPKLVQTCKRELQNVSKESVKNH